MTKILILLAVLVPSLSFAQGGGHVGRRHHQEQQQQQQMWYRVTKYSVVRGDKARAMYESLLATGVEARDMSEVCSQPVHSISGMIDNKAVQCFDRGNEVSGFRFKCYIEKKRSYSMQISANISEFFSRKPDVCGGDGIVDITAED